MLQQMAVAVFGANSERGGEGDPTRKYYEGRSQEIFKRDGYYVLSIPLPLVEREEVSLHRSVFDELVVRIGNWKRNLALPSGLAKLDVAGAKYEDDRLNILFRIEKGVELPPEALKPTRWETLRSRFRGS